MSNKNYFGQGTLGSSTPTTFTWSKNSKDGAVTFTKEGYLLQNSNVAKAKRLKIITQKGPVLTVKSSCDTVIHSKDPRFVLFFQKKTREWNPGDY